jgi:hypothetical protein
MGNGAKKHDEDLTPKPSLSAFCQDKEERGRKEQAKKLL